MPGMLTHQLRIYLYGCFAAALNAVANSVVAVMVAPDTFNLSTGAHNLLEMGAASALFGFFLYIRNHPLPDPADSDFAQAAQSKISAIVAQNVMTGTGDGSGIAARPIADLAIK